MNDAIGGSAGGPMAEPLRIDLPDAQATAELGARLADWVRARSGGLVYLYGDLGAGKTALVRGLLRGLGIAGTVRSPTYTLVEPYEVEGRQLFHVDLYRLAAPEELYALGFDEAPPTQAWWWVEWPQRAAGVLPPADACIRLEPSGEGRVAIVDCDDTALRALLNTSAAP